MNKHISSLLNAGFILFALFSFTQCQDETLQEISIEQKNTDIASSTITCSDVDNGIDYLNGIFYTKGTDGRSIETRKGTSKTLLTQNYTINVNKEGEYCFAAHILPVRLPSNLRKDSELQNVSVYVNGESLGRLNITKPDWEMAPINGKEKIFLKSGLNTITFESEAPFYPDIDAIKIADNIHNLMQENKKYNEYLNYLKQDAQSRTLNTRSAFTEQTDWQVTPKEYATPGCNYKHIEQVPVAFTYYKKLSLTKGNWTFETNPIQGESYSTVDPVMYLFKADDPHNYSYYNDDSNHFHPKIVAKGIPSGDYYLVIRSKNSWNAQSTSGREGLINVYCNGELMNENMPISGYIVNAGASKGTMNYFTAHTTGLATIWMIEHKSNKMKFKSSEYFFMDPQDSQWFNDARFSLIKKSDVTYDALISARGAMGFYFGNCDFYGSVSEAHSDYLKLFPNYKKGDALSSANNSNAYNSAAWAGGLTNCVFWGKSESGTSMNNYGSPYVWETWDSYFRNMPPRYENAHSYARDYEGEPAIAVWSTTNDMSGVTYFSVRGNTNEQAHGYAWETKITNKGRIFHPLNALSDTKTGKVIGYYYKKRIMSQANSRSTASEMTFEQSVREGRTVIEEVYLDEEQKQLIKSYGLLTRATSDLRALYEVWGKRINSDEFVYTSNPYTLIETLEGKKLVDYAKQHLEESIPFFSELIFSEKETETLEGSIIPFLFCELLKDTHAPLMETIKANWQKHNRTDKGAYIAPLPITFTKKYVKSVLDKDFLHREIETKINNQ